MRHDHLKKELDLLLLLTQNCQYTTDEICSAVGISRRSLYYYLDFFREAGFIVDKRDNFYYISRDSDFIMRLVDIVKISNEEAVLIKQLIDSHPSKTLLMTSLKKKMERFYDFKILENEAALQRATRSLSRLHEAIKEKRMVKLKGYSSNNSRTVSDRIVEPFCFMNHNNDIRCYEVFTGVNKTFRISRIGSVELLDVSWANEDKHRRVFTDMFMFSGEEHYVIELIFGQVAHNIMLDEYPMSAACFAPREDGRWYFKTEVCSYLGIGRFVLGLMEDIEVVGNSEFKEFLRKKLELNMGKL